ASLALGDELAAIAARRPVSRGFDYIAPESRVLWREIVLAGFPGALLVLGFARFLMRRRPPTLRVAEPQPPEIPPPPAAVAAGRRDQIDRRPRDPPRRPDRGGRRARERERRDAP